MNCDVWNFRTPALLILIALISPFAAAQDSPELHRAPQTPPGEKTDRLPDFIPSDGLDPEERDWSNFDREVDSDDLIRNPPAMGHLRSELQRTLELAVALRNTLHEIRDLQDGIHFFPGHATAGAAGAGNPAGKVVLITLADTNDGPIGNGCRENVKLIERLVTSQCSALQTTVEIKSLNGSNFNLRAFESTCQLLRGQVSNNDVIFLYVAAHGAYSGNRPFFQMRNHRTGRDSVFRSDIWNLLKDLGARQTILISDSCAFQSAQSATASLPPDPAAVAFDGHNALGKLLVFQTGDVDINASQGPPADNQSGTPALVGRGQFAIYDRNNGGLFTRAFDKSAVSANTPISWKKLMDGVQAEMDRSMSRPIPTSVPGFGTVNLRRQDWQRID